MATNKHAIIRYHALDKCFSNFGRKYYIEDLIEACALAIYDFTGKYIDVKRRQIYYDIVFMESEAGWSAPIERIRDGKKVYYRYADRGFSIKNQVLNETEINHLKETLLILNRFKGLPQLNWLEEFLVRIKSEFTFQGSPNPIVGFEQNPYLRGLEYLAELFNSIFYKKVLNINYQSYNQDSPVEMIIHPYYLKQYNSRWFLFGFNPQYNTISNLAIDRIISIKEINKEYLENENINFDEYFDDVIGATVKNEEPVKVLLKINNRRFPYIESKPIHGSQKIKERKPDGVVVELLLQINNELISLILSYGEDVTVISPQKLIDIIKGKAENILKNYF